MKASSLKYLASVADLARLDFEASTITLISRDKRMTAIYVGVYSGGMRSAESDADDFVFAGSASRFKALLALLSDAESVKVTCDEHELVLHSGPATTRIQRWGEPREEADVVPGESRTKASARLPLKVLTNEVSVASNFVSTNNMRPELTGVRLEIDEGMVITAFDGFGLLFKSEVDADTRRSDALVVPAQDLLLGLKLVVPEKIEVLVKAAETAAPGEKAAIEAEVEKAAEPVVIVRSLADAEKVLISNKEGTAYFNCSIYALPWPDISTVEQSVITGPSTTFTSSQLKALTTGGKALTTNEVMLMPTEDGQTSIRVESDAGVYDIKSAVALKQSVRFTLDAVGKLAELGDDVTLLLPGVAREHAYASVGSRRCWVVARVG